jgi:hypothetical protein
MASVIWPATRPMIRFFSDIGLRLFVKGAPRFHQALIQFGPFVLLQADGLENGKKQHLLHRSGSSMCQPGVIQRVLSTYYFSLMSFRHKRTFWGNFIKGWDECA